MTDIAEQFPEPLDQQFEPLEPTPEQLLAEERRQLEVALVSGEEAAKLDAFESLYRIHSKSVQSHLMGLTGGDKYLTEDIVQEAFLKALTHLDQFIPGSFGGWINTIATRLFIDSKRVGQRRAVEPLDETEESTPQYSRLISTPRSTEDTVAARLDLSPYIENIFNRMPEKFAAAILAVDVLDLSYAQAAQRLGVKDTTVRTQLFRGRQYFREGSVPEGYEEDFGVDTKAS
jgi:RNA polymerase sigma factor (sigma-70 family)